MERLKRGKTVDRSRGKAGQIALVPLLTQALEDCKEQRQKLQQKLRQCQALLRDWNSGALENLKLEESKTDKPGDSESVPSAQEIEELEQLNRALEKALRVRTKFQQPPFVLKEAAPVAKRKPVPGTSLKLPADPSTERTSKAGNVSQKLMPSKKPTTYMLRAPYRTDLDVKRPLGKRSTSLSPRASKAPWRSASPKAKLPVKIYRGPCRKAGGAAPFGKQPGCSRNSGTVKQNPSTQNTTSERDLAGTDLPSARGQQDGSSAVVGSTATPNHAGENALETATKPQTFNLQEKGSSLELPPPYRKAFSKYTRLLEKCSVGQTSPKAAAARSHFMEKLQATFFSPSLAFSPAEVREELTHLREVCSLARQCMDTETPASLGEDPTWERQYESLLTVDGLQSVVKECLDKVGQLREAMESYSTLLPADPRGDKTCSPGHCPSLRKPPCWDAKTVGLPPLLVYSSPEELKEVEALKLSVARLHQQLEIQEAMEAELLPLLEPGHLPEGSDASLYRAIYTLLCEGGETFPVLVKDEELSI
ncbi:hypothetical protein JRQ81_010127 [Phrynocephalus forsythii]|uniref:Tubulin epsilon and delta complex protein 2 n=1 Tax=Phrynocephalus forsythii TaxID=171643 RepID=A0A9Q0X7X7_9SAUR|nr:hypothetical protein JRQ81_010127 [Phrynocephalus forsythii]